MLNRCKQLLISTLVHNRALSDSSSSYFQCPQNLSNMFKPDVRIFRVPNTPPSFSMSGVRTVTEEMSFGVRLSLGGPVPSAGSIVPILERGEHFTYIHMNGCSHLACLCVMDSAMGGQKALPKMILGKAVQAHVHLSTGGELKVHRILNSRYAGVIVNGIWFESSELKIFITKFSGVEETFLILEPHSRISGFLKE